MSLILDGLQFVKETSTTEGDMSPGSPAPSLTLLGPPDGFESVISKIGNGNEGFFFLRHGFAWMRFRGTVTTPDQLSIDEVLASSDAGNPLVLGPGTKQVYCALDEYSVGRIAGHSLIAVAVASSSAVIDFTDLTDDFDEYMIAMTSVVPQANGADLMARISQDNGATFFNGAGYAWAYMAATAAPVAGNNGASGQTQMVLAPTLSNVSNRAFGGRLHIFSPLNSRDKYILTHSSFCDSSGNLVVMSSSGSLTNNTGANNAIRLFMSSGNIASGTFRLYGVRKA